MGDCVSSERRASRPNSTNSNSTIVLNSGGAKGLMAISKLSNGSGTNQHMQNDLVPVIRPILASSLVSPSSNPDLKDKIKPVTNNTFELKVFHTRNRPPKTSRHGPNSSGLKNQNTPFLPKFPKPPASSCALAVSNKNISGSGRT